MSRIMFYMLAWLDRHPLIAFGLIIASIALVQTMDFADQAAH